MTTVIETARLARAHAKTAQKAGNFEDAMRAAEQAADGAAAAYRHAHDDDDFEQADYAAHKAANALERAADLLRRGHMGTTTSAEQRQAWAQAEAPSGSAPTPGPSATQEELIEWVAGFETVDHIARLTAALLMHLTATDGEAPNSVAAQVIADEMGPDYTVSLLRLTADIHTRA